MPQIVPDPTRSDDVPPSGALRTYRAHLILGDFCQRIQGRSAGQSLCGARSACSEVQEKCQVQGRELFRSSIYRG